MNNHFLFSFSVEEPIRSIKAHTISRKRRDVFRATRVRDTKDRQRGGETNVTGRLEFRPGGVDRYLWHGMHYRQH